MFGLSSSLILAGVDVVIGDHPGVLIAVARDGESRARDRLLRRRPPLDAALEIVRRLLMLRVMSESGCATWLKSVDGVVL